MVNVFRLHHIIEPSAALFWAFGIVLTHILKQLTQPAGPASLKFGRGQLGSIWGKKSIPPPLFPSCCILILCIRVTKRQCCFADLLWYQYLTRPISILLSRNRQWLSPCSPAGSSSRGGTRPAPPRRDQSRWPAGGPWYPSCPMNHPRVIINRKKKIFLAKIVKILQSFATKLSGRFGLVLKFIIYKISKCYDYEYRYCMAYFDHTEGNSRTIYRSPTRKTWAIYDPCCRSKYIEFGTESWILAQFWKKNLNIIFNFCNKLFF